VTVYNLEREIRKKEEYIKETYKKFHEYNVKVTVSMVQKVISP